MAAKIGILGESTIVTNNTLTTLYTVPTDKAARLRFFFLAEAGSGVVTYASLMGSPNSEPTSYTSSLSNVDMWTGSMPLSTPDPPLGIRMNDSGVMQLAATIDLDNFDPQVDYIGAPLAADYYLSTGDTARFRIQGGDLLANLCQVQGVEDDA